MALNDPRPIPPGYALAHSRPWADLAPRVRFFQRDETLRIVMRLASEVPGNIVEFGVATGASTRVLASEIRKARRSPFSPYPAKKLFALDSFEGLREKFENAEIGTFAGEVPDIPGAIIVKGYFEDSCTAELARRVGRVAFASLDADLYSSTLFALQWLTPLLGTGSLLLFDEMVGGDQAEARASFEWFETSGLQAVRIAEFDREPSGWGATPDRRVLYQIVGDEPRATNRRFAHRAVNTVRRMIGG